MMVASPLEPKRERTSDDVSRGLAHLFKLRLWLWGTWLAFVPLAVIAAVLKPPESIVTPIAVFLFGSWVVHALVHVLYRCPACRRLFHLRGLYGNAFTPRCLHCGLDISQRARGA